MTYESKPVEIKPQNQMRRSTSNSSSADVFSSDQKEIEEELALSTPRSSFSRSNSARFNDDAEEKVYVAVGKEYKESKSTLLWALRKNRRARRFVLIHVHCPSQMIPIMGGWFHVSQLKPEQIEAYRVQERDRMNETLNEYMFICEIAKVQTEKIVIEMDDVTKGIIELIAQHGITRLVIGAAADKYYSKKMRVPTSKTTCIILKEAPSSCEMWFVCRGNLICTRQEVLDGCDIPESALASPSARSTESKLLRSKSTSQASCLSDSTQDYPSHMSRSCSVDCLGGESVGPSSEVESNGVVAQENLVIDFQEGRPKGSPMPDPLYSGDDDAESNVGSNSLPNDEEVSLTVISNAANLSSEDNKVASSKDQLAILRADDDWNFHLQQVVTEAANLINGAYKESSRRCKAEREAFEAHQKVKLMEVNYAKEVKQRQAVEESLSQTTLEIQRLKSHLDEVVAELQKVHKQKTMLEYKVTEFNTQVIDLEEKLSTVENLLNSLQKERDDAVKETDELRQKVASSRSTSFLEFSYVELEQATCNFEISLMIGEGGFGRVYKGYVRHTKVAIKVLHPDSLPSQSEFCQEVDILSRSRHPNLVTLVGACPEAFALIYEFLPNGSLEDRLSCKNNTAALSWQVRIRISAEICSALIFLHSNKPCSVVHGDLRPANILLDANLVSKLCDFSISRLLLQSSTNTLYNWTDPKGTFVYMDPEFFSTGELSVHSDIYSFGIVILRLLTGRPALGIVREVQDALEKGRLQAVLDASAGEWPLKVALQLAQVGLKCCEMKRRNRPDLARDILKVLESLVP